MMARGIIILVISMLVPAWAIAQTEPVITETGAELQITEIEPDQPLESEPDDGFGTAEGAPEVEVVPELEPEQTNFHGQLAKGHALYVSGDYTGALTAYDAAKTMAPGEAVVNLFVGYTQAKLGRYDDAILALRTITTMSGSQDASLHAKALFVIAWVEEMRGGIEAIEGAWTGYEGYAQIHNDALTFVTTAQARIAALERMRKLDEKYRIVRERIASGNQ
jgi:tetratricopeptide (TPR) repeat protein